MLPLLLAFLLHSASAALPDGIKACSQSANDYNECTARAIEDAVRFMKNGNRKFQIISLEPVRFNNFHIIEGHRAVAIDLLFTDVEFHGLSDIKVLNATNDWKQLNLKVEFPNKAHLKGNYKIKGKVLVLPIQGTGPCDIEFDNPSVNLTINFRTIEKNKVKYFEVSHIDFHLQPKGMHFNLQNLFNGDKALGDNMNLFLDTNWKEVMEELRPSLSKGLSDVITQLANLVFRKIPANQLQIP